MTINGTFTSFFFKFNLETKPPARGISPKLKIFLMCLFPHTLQSDLKCKMFLFFKM